MMCKGNSVLFLFVTRIVEHIVVRAPYIRYPARVFSEQLPFAARSCTDCSRAIRRTSCRILM